jgi:hypothetical protein
MNLRPNIYFAVLVCGVALVVAGCGEPKDIALVGVKPGNRRRLGR